eukprot:UN09512
MAWSFCQGFIHEKTLSNIKMREDEDELLDLMDQEMLEEKFGGKHCEFPPMSNTEYDFRGLVLEAERIYPENPKSCDGKESYWNLGEETWSCIF